MRQSQESAIAHANNDKSAWKITHWSQLQITDEKCVPLRSGRPIPQSCWDGIRGHKYRGLQAGVYCWNCETRNVVSTAWMKPYHKRNKPMVTYCFDPQTFIWYHSSTRTVTEVVVLGDLHPRLGRNQLQAATESLDTRSSSVERSPCFWKS